MQLTWDEDILLRTDDTLEWFSEEILPVFAPCCVCCLGPVNNKGEVRSQRAGSLSSPDLRPLPSPPEPCPVSVACPSLDPLPPPGH